MTVSDLLRLPMAAALAAVLCSSVSTPPAAAAPDPTRPAAPAMERLELRAHSDTSSGAGRSTARRAAASAVSSATVGLGRGDAVRGWRTDGFRQVGATWRGADPVLAVRTRTARGGWSPWQRLEPLHDGPTPASAEGRDGLRATDLWWAGEARDLQLRVRGRGHRDLRLVVIDPGGDDGTSTEGVEGPAQQSAATPARRAPASRSGVRTAAVATADSAPDHAPRPRLRSRRTWGANESWRNSAPRYNRRIEQVHVHHTVNSNDYTRADVPAMIRGMYRYHTKSLGWSDIGYNFLVDRFGRTWVGRAGGPGRKVRGAHTLGFNENSTGVAVIGNFERSRTNRRLRWNVAAIAAWKLDAVGKNPAARHRIWSHGSDRYRAGTRPRLPRVAGHRDTNHTACPGHHLYERLPTIRRIAQRRADRFS